MNKQRYLIGLALLGGCADSGLPLIDGFAPPTEADGYTRFVMPQVTQLQPGDDLMFCQWVAPPSETERQIVDTQGYQSTGGHHIALYATSQSEPIGTSRICTIRDMLTVNFVGAVGAEGVSAAKLPDGMAFNVPPGFALMTNTHYYNTSDDVIDAQSVVDVKFADPKHRLPGAGNVAVVDDKFSVPAGTKYTSDTYCKAPRKLSFFMWGNHMHEWGTHAFSEVIRADGRKELMSKDDDWSNDKVFNPAWSRWDTTSPFVVNPGDTFHVQCNWNNTTSAALEFPVEMCVSTGFTLEDMPQLVCAGTPEM
jgi:hypothetical protein